MDFIFCIVLLTNLAMNSQFSLILMENKLNADQATKVHWYRHFIVLKKISDISTFCLHTVPKAQNVNLFNKFPCL